MTAFNFQYQIFWIACRFWEYLVEFLAWNSGGLQIRYANFVAVWYNTVIYLTCVSAAMKHIDTRICSLHWTINSLTSVCIMWLEPDTDISGDCYSDYAVRHAVLNTEIDTGDCHAFECFPRRTIFSLVIWTHRDTTLYPSIQTLFDLYSRQIWIWTLERIQDRINSQWI